MDPSPSATYSDLIERAEQAASRVDVMDAAGAQRVLLLAKQFQQRPREAGLLVSSAEDSALRRELTRHFELLGRRGAKALPLAALARVLLADLSGTRRDLEEALNDCDKKLLIFGL